MTDEKLTSGSIEFRQEDGAPAPRSYVNDVVRGALLAARYRECAYCVDVISRQDEVYLGWKNGAPSVNATTARALSDRIALYQPPDDGYDDGDQSALYMRLQAIALMLEWGFQLAVGGKPEHHDPSILHAHPNIDDDLYEIEKEGRLLAIAWRLWRWVCCWKAFAAASTFSGLSKSLRG